MNITQHFPMLVDGIQYTLQITFAAFLIGLLLAIPISALRRSRLLPLRALGVGYVELLRAIPPLPWLFLVFFGLPEFGITMDPVEAGILVFGLISAAYLSEIYRSGFRAVPTGQTEAGEALGLSRTVIYLRVLIPQAVRTMIPLAIAYLIGLLKDSAVASVIGVQDISALAVVENQRTGQGLEVFISAAVLYLALSVPVAVAGRWLSHRLEPVKART
ncbi:amino acid ABC transporter permease [Streptomyces sp. NPDC001508]|uniref:amino acid ABC transporter permease n=1 Tax=Streptomyces sp. NPDC001508 TaxID=3154656 RepID=UPI00332477EF